MASQFHPVSPVVGTPFVTDPEALGQIHSRVRHAARVCDVCQLDCHFGLHVRRVEGIQDHSPQADHFSPGHNSEVARFYSRCPYYRTMHSGYAVWCVTPSGFASGRSGLTIIAVDSTIPDYLNAVLAMGISMFAKFVAVVVFSPVFLFPGVAAFAIGALVGQIYIKAQLSVKREMSNARSPVLSHFGAAIAGIGACASSV